MEEYKLYCLAGSVYLYMFITNISRLNFVTKKKYRTKKRTNNW